MGFLLRIESEMTLLPIAQRLERAICDRTPLHCGQFDTFSPTPLVRIRAGSVGFKHTLLPYCRAEWRGEGVKGRGGAARGGKERRGGSR